MKTIRTTIGLCLMVIALVSCSKDESIKPEEPVASCNIIEVSGNIDEPTVWEAGFVYVIKGSNVTVRSVLTIQPGVTVKIKDASIDVVGGKIIARGTSDQRIVFTSLADDRYCGDTNGDKTATNPAKGDWEQIYLNGTTETIFQYVDIFYAGQNRGGSSKAVEISGSNSLSFTFDNCRIAHTLYQDASYDASSAFYGSSYMKNAAVSKFTNNALYDNGKPIQISAYYTLDPSNVFHNPEDPNQKNTHNGIYLHGPGSGASEMSVTWNNTEVPYVLDANWHQVHPSSTITIKPNVIVKFKNPGDGINSRYGNVHLDPKAILTSYKDDAHGGDTNGDGNTTAPAVGDWEGFANTDIYSEWISGPNILYAEN